MKIKSKQSRAFTSVELLAVLGMIALLTMVLLPALSKARSKSRVVACAANFRQWGVSVNMYAKDNREGLPSFELAGGGAYLWDIGTNACIMMGNYGVNAPAWFCPVRPNEFETANAWAYANLGHSIQTIEDVDAFFRGPSVILLIMTHNYWVPRQIGNTSYPTDYSITINPALIPQWARGTAPAIYGWPKKLHDAAAQHVPFISDKCGSGTSGGFTPPASGNISSFTKDISPNTAHFENGRLIGVNAAFVDGHVEARSPSEMRAVYFSDTAYWFY